MDYADAGAAAASAVSLSRSRALAAGAGATASTTSSSKSARKRARSRAKARGLQHASIDDLDDDAVPVPQLDELPGSRIPKAKPYEEDIEDEDEDDEDLSTPSMTSSSSTASDSQQVTFTTDKSLPLASRTTSASASAAYRARVQQRQRKAKRRSNLILACSGLPIAAAVVFDYLQPAKAMLDASHTRIPTWRLSTFAGRCLHLSYQIPLEPRSLLSSSSTSSSTSLLSSPTVSSSSILANLFSTSATAPRFHKGPDDAYIVVTWVLVFLLLRESLMRFVFNPLARRGGLRKTGALLRFGEQGYDVLFHTVGTLFGICIMQNVDSGYKNGRIDGLWENYPHDKLHANLKFYYLTQAAFWVSQIITIHMEKKRKDYLQMLSHHFITVSLLYLSYIFNFTRIGNVILILMDLCDIQLGTAKMLKYLGYERACDAMFVAFMLGWIATRNIAFPRVLYSVIFDAGKFLKEYRWEPENGYYWSRNMHVMFVGLLGALQVLLVWWFFMILKVAWAVVCGKPAEDSRSDDEDDSTTTEDLRSGRATPNGGFSSSSRSRSSSSEGGSPINSKPNARRQQTSGPDTIANGAKAKMSKNGKKRK